MTKTRINICRPCGGVRKARKVNLLCLAALTCGVFSVMPVASSFAQSAEMQTRINRLENEIETLSRAVYKGETPPPGDPSLVPGGDSVASARLEVRLSQIEGELRALTGRVEEQGYELARLKSMLDQAQLTPQQAAVPEKAPAPVPATSSFYGESAVSTYPVDSAAPAADQDQKPADENQLGTLTQIDTATAPAAAASDTAVAQAPAGNPTDMYEVAFSFVRDRKYDEAEKSLQEFLDRYPGHALAPNAKYWLGETFYVRGNFERAARIFAEAYQQFPKGPKGPDNLLKLALSLAGLGKKDDACIALAQLKREYPAGFNPVLDRADQEMKTIGCP